MAEAIGQLARQALPQVPSRAQAVGQQLQVSVVRDPAALAAVVPAWEALAADAAEPNPLYEPWFMLPALEAQADRGNFASVLVWAGDELAGLFPFVLERRLKGLPVNVLRSWNHNSWTLCTPLVRAGRLGRRSLDALLDWLKGPASVASCAELRYVPIDGPFHGMLADALRSAPAMVVPTGEFGRAFLRRGPSAEAYLDAALSKGARKDLRRRARRLQERGPVAQVAWRPGEDPEPWIADLLRLEASGWKGRQGSALASSQANLRFATQVMREAARRGRLQMIGIDYEGRAIARCCNLLAGEGSYGYRAAYDEAFACFSPGIMAEVQAIRAFHECEGLQWQDSLTDPDNETINRLWKDRRVFRNLLIGTGAWGEFSVSLMPLLRWARSRVRAQPDRTPEATFSPAFRKS